jgi:hypothetical protein
MLSKVIKIIIDFTNIIFIYIRQFILNKMSCGIVWILSFITNVNADNPIQENKLIWGFIDPVVNVGNLLTSITILVTLISISLGLAKERDQRQKDRANKVREAGSKTIAKLDRWLEYSLSMFQDMETAFVETTEDMLKDAKAKDQDWQQKAKDSLWKKLNTIESQRMKKVLEDDIETVYEDLYGYDPSVRAFFERVLDRMKIEEDIMFRYGILFWTQEEVLSNELKMDTFETAYLYNKLKTLKDYIRDKYKDRMAFIINPVQKQLLDLISDEDEKILSKKKLLDDRCLEDMIEFDPFAYDRQKPLMLTGNSLNSN